MDVAVTILDGAAGLFVWVRGIEWETWKSENSIWFLCWGWGWGRESFLGGRLLTAVPAARVFGNRSGDLEVCEVA